MSHGHLMGLDAGGGGARCLLVDVARGTVTTAFRPWKHRVAPGTGGFGYDLDLEHTWSRLCEVAREVRERAGAGPGGVLGVAVTSMRHTTVVLGADGAPRLATPNRDARAAAEAVRLAEAHGAELQACSGHWPAPILAGPRLAWLQAHAPQACQDATFLTLGDWVAWRLCGERVSDASQSGETLLLDVSTREWSWEWIERLGLPRSLMPPLRDAGSRLGALGARAAGDLGLHAGTPVAVGGADSQCGLLGAGVAAAGQLGIIAGTSAPLQIAVERPVLAEDGRLWTGCHVVPGLWVLESNAGPMGEALEWFGHLMNPECEEPAVRLLAEAACSEPGAAGMLSTLGCVVMDARQIGVPVGSLTLSHLSTADDAEGRHHLARSIVEGMACALRANLEQLLARVEAEPVRIRLAGGLSRSDTWCRLVAEVLDRPIEVAAVAEASALGAAVCAGVGADCFPDLAAGTAALADAVRVRQPDRARAATYRQVFASWQSLRAARSESDALAARITLPAVLRSLEANAARAPASFHRPRLLVTAALDDASLSALRALGDVEYAPFREAGRLLAGPALVEALQGADVFVTEVDVVDAASLGKLPGLRVVVSCRSDAVNVDLEAATACGIPVLHAPGRNADAVADFTLACLLMLARQLPAATAFLREPGGRAGDMGRMGRAFSTLQGRELWRKTVGLVGLGAVGRAVARRLRGFGARVLASDPLLGAEQMALAGAKAASLDALLAQSDFVSLHAPVTEHTRALIGARELARMKRGAFLVNTARAALVDEDALVAALESGHLAGAALDVFAVEPPGSDHPLLRQRGVIATPHLGGNTAEVAAHQGRLVVDELTRLLRRERPHHVLNPHAWEAFDWERPRPEPAPGVLARLAARRGPAVTDLESRPPPAARPPASAAPSGERRSGDRSLAPHPPQAAHAAPRKSTEKMERILAAFVAGALRDPALRAADNPEVTLHFALSDLPLELHLRVGGGQISGATTAPEAAADVELHMRAEVFDGMFTGRLNAMQAAMDGRLSFSGDTAKAMTLQALQADLSRLYAAARAEVGDPGNLAALPGPGGGPAEGPPEVVEDALRTELVTVVGELYAQQLITATGGNVSARIADGQELWITPGQMFKGSLRPESLVRIDLDGRALDPGTRSASSERLMHCAVYRARTEVQAVVHAHAPNATILANADLPFLPVSTEAAFFGDIPRMPFVMPGTRELARAVTEAMGSGWAVLMKNHGLLVAGRSLRRAADMVEIIERSAQIILGAHALGRTPPTLPDEVVRKLRAMGDLVA